MVVGMVILGGLTRLTDSGLSITEWEPLKGALPPIGDEWQVYFDKYKQIPEYLEINAGMSLAEFKEIFWLEYIHRLFGRIAGFVFFIPFVYFIITNALSFKLIVKLAFIFALGGLQGFVGWYMVSSGLSERTDVSQFRLAFHLIVAFVIYALLFWTAMDIKNPERKAQAPREAVYSKWLTAFIFFMIFLGALVAGTDAGFIGGSTFYIPDELWAMDSWWLNHFENRATIQFQHRLFAILLAIAVPIFVFVLVKKHPEIRKWAGFLNAALALQIILGISTLQLFHGLEDYFAANGYHKMWQPAVIVAELHQLGALLLLSMNLIITHKLLRK